MKISVNRLATLIKLSLSDDLRRKPWKGAENKYAGHCYVASEAFYHLVDRRLLWKPMFVRHESSPHWYLQHKVSGEIIDLTSEQFMINVRYEDGRGKGFLTKKPSKRARILMTRVSMLANKR